MKRVTFIWMAFSGMCFLLLLGAARLPAQAPQESAKLVFIKAGRLIDVRAGKVLDSYGILVEGDRIREVGPVEALAAKVPKNVPVIDLTDRTVMPGLIDCHTHIVWQFENYLDDTFRKRRSITP